MSLFEPLVLPNGTAIPNRMCKAAMEENMSTHDHVPSDAHYGLYQSWAEGGAGLILSGNVMIDRRAMTGPGAVILENDHRLECFREWARVGRTHGAQFWLQINHPGRQMLGALGQQTVAPSAVPLELGALSKLFGVPREMTENDIHDVVQRFATTSSLAERAGFSGVQIHAAHGYLLSQFLSPLTNRRTDSWGGSLENRARLLIEVIEAVRAAVSQKFCVALKLNSADFQRGGFDTADARIVLEMLNGLRVDLVEISGGNYEAPATQGDTRDGRTLAREAYFLEFAKDMVAIARMPLMVTGGIHRRETAECVLASGVSVVGMASALALEPSLPRRWQRNEAVSPKLSPIKWRHKLLAARAYMASIKYQMRAIGRGKRTNPDVSPLLALIMERLDVAKRARQYRRWIAAGA